VLPGLHEKYPDAVIDWHVRSGFDFALWHNPYIRKVIIGPVVNTDELHSKYDLVITPDHHYRWNKPMAVIHCEQADVPFHKPELYFKQEELDSVPSRLRGRVIVANNAGWKSRECPMLSQALEHIALQQPGILLQVDRLYQISPRIECYKGTLRGVAAVMKFAKLYIGIDTVFMHVAVALGLPMVLILGPTGPESQYIPNSVFIRPFVHLNPAQTNPATERRNNKDHQASSIT
jgi:hypothetical protein